MDFSALELEIDEAALLGEWIREELAELLRQIVETGRSLREVAGLHGRGFDPSTYLVTALVYESAHEADAGGLLDVVLSQDGLFDRLEASVAA